jgi:hypothetical protein
VGDGVIIGLVARAEPQRAHAAGHLRADICPLVVGEPAVSVCDAVGTYRAVG